MTGSLVLWLEAITTTFNAWTIDEEKFGEIQGAVTGENQELPETMEITIPKLNLGVSRECICSL